MTTTSAISFSGTDGRIIFAIPYETDFTLIGTTDQEHQGPPGTAVCTPEERDYLLRFASQYFARTLTEDDGRLDLFGRPAALRRRGKLGHGGRRGTTCCRSMIPGAPLLNVFGGKNHHLPAAGRSRSGEADAVLPHGGWRLDGGRRTSGRGFRGGRLRRSRHAAPHRFPVPVRPLGTPPRARLRDRGAGDPRRTPGPPMTSAATSVPPSPRRNCAGSWRANTRARPRM